MIVYCYVLLLYCLCIASLDDSPCVGCALIAHIIATLDWITSGLYSLWINYGFSGFLGKSKSLELWSCGRPNFGARLKNMWNCCRGFCDMSLYCHEKRIMTWALHQRGWAEREAICMVLMIQPKVALFKRPQEDAVFTFAMPGTGLPYCNTTSLGHLDCNSLPYAYEHV